MTQLRFYAIIHPWTLKKLWYEDILDSYLNGSAGEIKYKYDELGNRIYTESKFGPDKKDEQ